MIVIKCKTKIAEQLLASEIKHRGIVNIVESEETEIFDKLEELSIPELEQNIEELKKILPTLSHPSVKRSVKYTLKKLEDILIKKRNAH
jgi:hypothetical protein